MLSFRINNEVLVMLPGAQLEMEENNPFLQFGDEVVGEYSLPVELPNASVNNRITGYAGTFQKEINPAGLDAIAYDTGFQHSRGKLKIEKVIHDLNNANRSSISAYFLTGTSSFWQDIKNKKLRDVAMGGAHTFAFDNFNTAGAGFWGHIHAVANAAPGAYDYAFYPALVDGFGYGVVEDMKLVNYMYPAAGGGTNLQFGQANATGTDANAIVPFPYLKFVLLKIFESIGWTLDGAILSDVDFQKATLTNTRCIDWAVSSRFFPLDLRSRPNISFNLSDHLPDVTISEFMAACRKRFGWWYDVDRVNKVVRIVDLSTVAITAVKDMSRKASPIITKTMLTDKTIYAVRNSSGTSAVTLDGLDYGGEVAAFSDLPAPTEAIDNKVYLDVPNNNYLICLQNDSGDWGWELYAPNNGDVEPAGFTEEVVTNSTVPGNETFVSRHSVIFNAPRIAGSGMWPGRTDENTDTEIQFCFYHGHLLTEQNYSCPFGSHHIYDPKGNKVGNWSLAFLGKDKDGNEVGLYQRKLKPFLDRLQATQELEVTLYLNRAEFMALKYSDALLINGVKMYIKQRKYVIPYKNALTLTCIRIMK